MNVVIWYRCNKQIRDMFGFINNIKPADLVKSKQHYDKLIDLGRGIETSIRSIKNDESKHTESIVSTDKATIKEAFDRYKRSNMTGVIHTGLRGINAAYGKTKGAALGSSNIFAALSHNYKSEMLLSVAKWHRECNTFPVKDGKSPVVLYVSLENEASQNLMMWYQRLHGAITGTIDFENKSDEEVINDIYCYFKESDLTFVINRYLPFEFDVETLKELVEDYEEAGYYVVSVIIDYMSQMKKPKGDSKHEQIKNLYNYVRNYLQSKEITLWSAHQLNRDAAKIAATTNNAVKYFNESHMADCIDVYREIDNLFMLHIEKNHLGEPHLTINLCKKRYSSEARAKSTYAAYKFSDIGIIDDYNLPKNMSIQNIYSVDDETQDNVF
jgi:hypothetical protein